MAAERVECVDKTAFYEAVDILKSQQKTKQSQITLFVEYKFYDKAKQYLKSIIEDDLIVDQVQEDRIKSLPSTWEATTITQKKWKYSNDNIVTEKNKKVVSNPYERRNAAAALQQFTFMVAQCLSVCKAVLVSR